MASVASPSRAESPAAVSAWVNLRTILDVLGTYRARVLALVDDGRIRCIRREGGRNRYCLADALRVLAESEGTTPAA